MGEGGLRFQIAGIPVSLPLGGVLAVLLIAYLWAPTFEQPGSSGLFLAGIFAVLLYVGVLVHELAHAWAARSFGYPVQGITLWLLGGYTVYERRDSKPGPEFVISVVGPLSTLAIAAGCWVLAGVTSGSVSVLLSALAFTNLLLGALNLLPGAPLDGGGIVKSAVWRATGSENSGARAAGYAGLIVAGLVGALAVVLLSRGAGGLLTAVLAVFLGFGAYQSLHSAKQGRALDWVIPRLPQMIRPVLAVSEADRLDAVLSRWDQASQVAVVTVDGRGRLLAALSLAAADAVPADQRGAVAVGPFTVAIPAEQRVVLDDQPSRMLQALADSGQSVVFVTEPDGRPLGVLMAADVNAALDRR